MEVTWPTLDEAGELDLEDLGLCLLHRLAGRSPDFSRINFRLELARDWVPDQVLIYGAGLHQVDRQRREEATRLLEEAFDYLVREGLLAQSPHDQRPSWYIISRKGEQVLASAQLPDLTRIRFAQQSLRIDLHPTLSAKGIDTLFRQGRFETAIRDALVLIEDAVRARSRLKSSGVKLMEASFMPGGPLADPARHQGEQNGLQRLFMGVFGALRNVLAHTSYRFNDNVVALESLLLVDLLTRRLQEEAERLGLPL